MRSSRVSFPNHDGQQLAALLDRPVDDEPIAYALMAHCFTCSKNYKGVSRISRALARQGIAVLRFDFTGLGESEGAFSDTTFSSNVDDLLAAVRFMEGEFAAPKLLIGHSLGGAAVLAAAGRIPSATAVATIAAPSSPAHLLRHIGTDLHTITTEGEAEVNIGGRPFRIRREFVEDIGESGLEKAVAELDRALLVFHSPVDPVVGIDNATEIFVNAKHPKSFVSLDTADHLLTDADDANYVGAVIAAWARRYIDGPQEQVKAPEPGDDLVVVRTGDSGYRTEIMANGHPLVADEPVSVGGTNTGPSPYELLSAALGACTTMTLRMYADRKKWPLAAAEARVRHAKVHCTDCGDPENRNSRIDQFSRQLVLEGPLDDAQRDRLLAIADRCPVHRTLHSDVVVTTEIVDD
jgi:putative redox protein